MVDRKPASLPDPGHRPSVMIVDDDAEMRALLRDALERDGFDVRENSGGHLVPLLERRAPDAIVLDKEMAGVNGLDLLSYIRRRHPGLPVIVVTARRVSLPGKYFVTTVFRTSTPETSLALRSPLRKTFSNCLDLYNSRRRFS